MTNVTATIRTTATNRTGLHQAQPRTVVITGPEALTAWRAGNDAGHGYHPYGDLPADEHDMAFAISAAIDDGGEVVLEHDGLTVLQMSDGGLLGIADSNGPWAVDLASLLAEPAQDASVVSIDSVSPVLDDDGDISSYDVRATVEIGGVRHATRWSGLARLVGPGLSSSGWEASDQWVDARLALSMDHRALVELGEQVLAMARIPS
jgi:hypothetical protein